MRFLQIVTASGSAASSPEHRAKASQLIRDAIAAGTVLATGGLGKRSTSAARITRKNGEIAIEDPPSGDGWMSAGGYSLVEFASKEEAIADAETKLEFMGDGVIELIQVSEMHPRAQQTPREAGATLPLGVVPYLTIDGASDASLFYQKAFGAREVARMPAEDGKRLMHCHLEINGGALMLADNFPEMGGPPVLRSSSYTLQLVIADGDAWWNRAIQAGCTPKLPFALAPWGDKYGQLSDPFGLIWALNSPAR